MNEHGDVVNVLSDEPLPEVEVEVIQATPLPKKTFINPSIFPCLISDSRMAVGTSP